MVMFYLPTELYPHYELACALQQLHQQPEQCKLFIDVSENALLLDTGFPLRTDKTDSIGYIFLAVDLHQNKFYPLLLSIDTNNDVYYCAPRGMHVYRVAKLDQIELLKTYGELLLPDPEAWLQANFPSVWEDNKIQIPYLHPYSPLKIPTVSATSPAPLPWQSCFTILQKLATSHPFSLDEGLETLARYSLDTLDPYTETFLHALQTYLQAAESRSISLQQDTVKISTVNLNSITNITWHGVQTSGNLNFFPETVSVENILIDEDAAQFQHKILSLSEFSQNLPVPKYQLSDAEHIFIHLLRGNIHRHYELNDTRKDNTILQSYISVHSQNQYANISIYNQNNCYTLECEFDKFSKLKLSCKSPWLETETPEWFLTLTELLPQCQINHCPMHQVKHQILTLVKTLDLPEFDALSSTKPLTRQYEL